MNWFVLSALSIPLVLNGCGTTEPTKPAPITDPRKVWCRLEKPMEATTDEFMSWSTSQKQAFVAHNERGEKWCGWKPPT